MTIPVFVRKSLLALIGLAGIATAIFGLLLGMASMPDCGPWLPGPEYLACKQEGSDSTGLAIFFAGFLIALLGFGLFNASEVSKAPKKEETS